MIGAIFDLGKGTCSGVRTKWTEYLDNRLTGREMQRISEHLESCGPCAQKMDEDQGMLRVLGGLSAPKAPEDLLLKIRVSLSQERAQRNRDRVAEWQLTWRNTLGPVLLQMSAGLASAVLLLGSVTLLVGMFAHPEQASAQDEPIGERTAPRFLYESGAASDVQKIGTVNGPVVVEAYVTGSGRVYDYRIVSGSNDAQTQAQVESLLLSSVFEPARFFGQPVRGLAVLSFAGVAVHG